MALCIHMKRTTVMLPEALRARAMRRAQKLGISLGAFVRRSMEALLAESGSDEEDPLLADDAVYGGPVPTDLAEHHDRCLYGPERT